MTSGEVSEMRLAHQQLSVHRFRKPEDVVTWMGAMQAQDLNMARFAIALRLTSIDRDIVRKAIDDGRIIRTHVMRPTWHFIPARDASWMIDLTAPQIKSSAKSRMKELGLTPAILKKGLRLIEQILDGRHLTREELLTELGRSRIPVQDQGVHYILLWAELEKVICSGPLIRRKSSYALFDDRVTEKTTLSRDEALAELARRYFRSHGPATVQDFINWSALPAKDARMAVEFIGKDFASERVGEQTYWFKDSKIQQDRDSGVFLLPAFDEFVIGYKDRSACLPAKHSAAAISVNGIFWPVIVVNGTVRGLWKRTVVKGKVNVELKFFRGQRPGKDKSLLQLLDSEVQKIKSFFAESATAE